jgi:hypothetical protein
MEGRNLRWIEIAKFIVFVLVLFISSAEHRYSAEPRAARLALRTTSATRVNIRAALLISYHLVTKMRTTGSRSGSAVDVPKPAVAACCPGVPIEGPIYRHVTFRG